MIELTHLQGCLVPVKNRQQQRMMMMMSKGRMYPGAAEDQPCLEQKAATKAMIALHSDLRLVEAELPVAQRPEVLLGVQE